MLKCTCVLRLWCRCLGLFNHSVHMVFDSWLCCCVGFAASTPFRRCACCRCATRTWRTRRSLAPWTIAPRGFWCASPLVVLVLECTCIRALLREFTCLCLHLRQFWCVCACWQACVFCWHLWTYLLTDGVLGPFAVRHVPSATVRFAAAEIPHVRACAAHHSHRPALLHSAGPRGMGVGVAERNPGLWMRVARIVCTLVLTSGARVMDVSRVRARAPTGCRSRSIRTCGFFVLVAFCGICACWLVFRQKKPCMGCFVAFGCVRFADRWSRSVCMLVYP